MSSETTIGHDTPSGSTFGALVDYPVVDTETHLIFRSWPLDASPQVSAVDPYTHSEFSGLHLVAEMERCGVDYAIVIGYDGYDFAAFMNKHGGGASDFMGGRRYTQQWVSKYPNQLRYVTTLHDPRTHSNAIEELVSEFEVGAIGIKIFPAYLNLIPDAPEIREAFDVARELSGGVIFGFEDTVPPETPSLMEMYEGLGRLIGDYSDVPVQLNHGGNADPFTSEMQLLTDIVTAHPDVLVSTSVLGGVKMEWRDAWRFPFPEYLARLAAFSEAMPERQLAWGTDWPWFEGVLKYPQLLQAIVDHATFLSEDAKRLYLGENAIRHWNFEDSA